MYQMNFAGLMESYAAGIPFFRTQILGDFIYSGALFGAMETARYFAKNHQKFAKKSAKTSVWFLRKFREKQNVDNITTISTLDTRVLILYTEYVEIREKSR